MKKSGKVWAVVLLVIAIFIVLGIIIFAIVSIFNSNNKISSSGSSDPQVGYKQTPLNSIILQHTGNVTYLTNEGKNQINESTRDSIIEEAVKSFNEEYVMYIMNALGTSNLHKSYLTLENPKINLDLGENEIWGIEIKSGEYSISKTSIEGQDLNIKMSREEAVKSILANDMKEFMKNSVGNGNTVIEPIANEAELYSKGYLEMYKELEN
ncbi:MAG: hypothetical protein ACP5OG_00020 [Candidatus Nanoarchaeia archaeon]